MKARTIMLQGTASSVGKSVLAAALCRIFKQDGLRVAPFKAQNMALNSFVTKDGGEMGRAQVVQAEAAGIEPDVLMNPVLLKPEADARSQIVVMGRAVETLSAREYYRRKTDLLAVVESALETLRENYDVVVIEGAGSPAEINLKANDIVNMRVAKLAEAPVLLVGDIDRGGVFASLVGTMELLEPDEVDLVKGFIVNKFRGDISLLDDGLKFLENRTGKPVIGVVPYYKDILIAQEDSVYLENRRDDVVKDGQVDVVVIQLPHISNFDDFDPLEAEADVLVRYVREPGKLGNPDLLILPGTKSTVADLEFLRKSGLAEGIINLSQQGTPLIGICGGYQLLGEVIQDPDGVESSLEEVEGLGLLPIRTVFEREKVTSQVKALAAAGEGILSDVGGAEIVGYEIHMGRSAGSGLSPAFRIVEKGGQPVDLLDGSLSADGQILGTYIHGVFEALGFRRAVLKGLRKDADRFVLKKGKQFSKDDQYDKLAQHVRNSLDMRMIHGFLGV